MRHSSSVILAGVAIGLALVAQPVRGQTQPGTDTATPVTTGSPTPTATVVGTPVFPAGKDLVAAAQQLLLAKKTAHLVITGTTRSGQVTGKIQGAGDVEFETGNSHHLTTSHTTRLVHHQRVTSSLRIEQIQVGKMLATRTKGGAWHCIRVTTATASYDLANPFNTKHPATTVTFTTVGTATVLGIPAWRVRVTDAAPQETPVGGRISVSYYLAQADSTLLRLSVKLTGRINVGTSNKKKLVAYSFVETEDLSNYGEAVTFTLPAACKGKTVDFSGSQAEVRHGAIDR